MKPHLPITLLSAVLAAFVTLPSQAVEAPEGYNTIYLPRNAALGNYATLTEDKHLAFILSYSAELTTTNNPHWGVYDSSYSTFSDYTPLINGGNLFFGSYNSNSPVALSFKDGGLYTYAFYNQKTLTFDTLSNLTFSNISYTAIYLDNDSTLTITNINDGQDGTVDLLFENMTDWAICGNGANVNLCNNGDVSFRENSLGTIYDVSSMLIDNNANVTFSGNNSNATGAIRRATTLTISRNISVTFNENNSVFNGGAINASTLNICNNSVVTFSGNESSKHSGAINATNLTISNNGDVTFNGNAATLAYYVNGDKCIGGAIYASSDPLTICDNDNVTFSGNSCNGIYDESYNENDFTNSGDYDYVRGGAIYAENSVTISGNGNVIFSDNSASSVLYATSGGAIYADNGLLIDNNGTVTFSGNSSQAITDSHSIPTYGGAIYAKGGLTISNNESVTFSDNFTANYNSPANSSAAYGGAVYADGGLSISNNNDVTFSRNTGSEGGAIYTEGELFIIDNASVTFNDNAAISGVSRNGGGAIVAQSGLTISNNDNVSFSGNSAVTNTFSNSYGGAIYTSGKLNITHNDYVGFNGNSCAANSHTLTYGGAIYATKEISISNNGLVSFCDNSTYTDYSGTPAGGAIYAASSLNISNNRDVYFISNSASSGNTPAPYGGAIYATDGLTISNNSNVFITVNSVSSANSSSAYGGAIYVSSGNLSMQGNETVLFERNYEKCGTTYRLRSIYMNSGSMILSAKTGRDITFRDSVYTAGDSYFNSDYTDANGNTQSAGGDIIFTGKYTEENLKEVLAINNEGRSATAEEILNSQTSTIEGNAYVNGGSLQITDGAILNVNGDTINIAAGSNATLAINDAELVAANATIEVGESATLQLSNGAAVTADEIDIAAGATLVLGDIAITAEASDAMVAAYRLSSLNIINADLTFSAGSTLVTDGTGITMTEGSVLTFNATSEGEKINLVFTLGTEYNEDGLVQLFSNVDIVKFLMDGEEVDSSTTLLASDFFTGDYINENTTLTYDSTTGSLYLQQNESVPEPTTATLSLLALAALSMRRRRR